MTPTIDIVIACVATHFGVSSSQVTARVQRTQDMVRIRLIAIYSVRTLARVGVSIPTLQRIGDCFGTDHSNVSQTMNSVGRTLAKGTDPELPKDLDAIAARVRSACISNPAGFGASLPDAVLTELTAAIIEGQAAKLRLTRAFQTARTISGRDSG